MLASPNSQDALANGGGSFLSAFTRDVAIVDSRHFNVQIDAIKQRTRDALTVALYLDWAAAAFALEIAEVTARAGMRCLFARQHYGGFVAPTDYTSHG